jgi:hypothetical protein
VKRSKRVKRRRSYADKRATQGGDSYGTWREGKRLSPERIAGKVIH